MGFFDSWSDLVSAATPWGTAEAEAVSGGTGTDKTPAQKDEGDEREAKDPSGPTPDKKGGDDEDEKEESEGDDEPEEEDEEELVDPKEAFEEECRESKACAPVKHHFDECVERVTGTIDEHADKKHPGEDCVEEFFHLAHCANQCAAPKLWAALK